MPDYVIDANVLISFLISGKASHKNILRSFHFLAPEFILTEVKQYQQEIFTKTKQSESQLRTYTLGVFGELTVLPDYFTELENLLLTSKMLEKN
jgi:predicted nucleic acid-binding protein